MVICRNENLIKRAAEVALNNLAERGDAALRWEGDKVSWNTSEYRPLDWFYL